MPAWPASDARGSVLAAFAAGLYLAVKLFGGAVEWVPGFAPSFDIKLRDGSFAPNTGYEAHEQQGLFKHWDPSFDTGINVGVYVGTSCIFLDKLLEGNGLSEGEVRTACVEPNTRVLPVTRENLAKTHRHVEFLHGIVSDEAHCPSGASLLDGHGAVGSNATLTAEQLEGMHAGKWEGMHGDTDEFRIEQCFTFDHIRSVFGGKLPAVWFVDCDGCLPDLYGQFKDHFADPSVRLLLYERESFPGSADPEYVWEAKYRVMEDGLRAQGFVAKQCLSNMLWGVWVWERGGPRFTVRVWCLALWVAFLLGAARCADAAAQRLRLRLATPIWRLPVLAAWYAVYSRLPVLPTNLKEPITGLDCTWTCAHEGLAFILSNYLFVYAGVLWGASKACQPQHPWLVLLATAQAAVIAGFVAHGVATPQLEPMCYGPGPQQTIWQATVVCALCLCALAQLQGAPSVTPADPEKEAA